MEDRGLLFKGESWRHALLHSVLKQVLPRLHSNSMYTHVNSQKHSDNAHHNQTVFTDSVEYYSRRSTLTCNMVEKIQQDAMELITSNHAITGLSI